MTAITKISPIPISAALAAALFAMLFGCAGPDYDSLEQYYRVNPKTILVLPAQNLTTDAEAPHFFMATIGKPLVNRGYYVMPVPLVADLLAHEGIGLAGEAWTIDPARLNQYLGADAILYTTIEEWDTNYFLVSSAVKVALDYRLVDARTGDTLWAGKGRKRVEGGGFSASLGGLIANTLDAAFTAAVTDYVPLAAEVNRETLANVPPGVYHADYEELQKEIADWKKNR